MNLDDDQLVMGSLVGTSKCQAHDDFSGNKAIRKKCKAINNQWKNVKVKKNDPSQEKERAQAREDAREKCIEETHNIQGYDLKVCEWR